LSSKHDNFLNKVLLRIKCAAIIINYYVVITMCVNQRQKRYSVIQPKNYSNKVVCVWCEGILLMLISRVSKIKINARSSLSPSKL